MLSRNTLSTMVGGAALGAGLAMSLMANAQTEEPPRTTTVLVAQPSAPAASSNLRPLAPEHQKLHVTPLGPETFVTVKDHGDAQTVSVFKVDARGVNHLMHKAKFFY